ncbi:hypothetical protein WAX46_09845 [Bacillus sp. FJAT-53060]|uniref:hypothetical protein n=1 Tax=Bacillus TaxID=1386 RepID=UPI001CFB0DEF|nr:hypothetical protein [Bacillus stratosphericus]
MLIRPLRVDYVASKNYIITVDTQGVLHRLNDKLEVVKSSAAPLINTKVYCLTATDDYIYTRDYFGVLSKYCIETLKKLQTLHTEHYALSEKLLQNEEPSPSNARGIRVFGEFLYTTNGFGQIMKLNKESLVVEEIIEHPSNEKTFIDYFNVENAIEQIITDKEGNLFFGDLSKLEFNRKIKVDEGSVHVVRYDPKNNRYIATQDYGLENSYGIESGLAIIDPESLTFTSHPFTTDDVEFIFFDKHFTEIYTGGFDGKIYVFDNMTSSLKLKRTLGPFNHQISYGLMLNDDRILVLLQSGEMLIVDKYGNELEKLDFDYICYWDFVNGESSNEFYAPNGKGITKFVVEEVNDSDIIIREKEKFVYNFGLIFKLVRVNSSRFVALSRKNLIFSFDENGYVLWSTNLEYLPKSISCCSNKQVAMVGLDNGIMQEIDLNNGRLLRRKNFDAAVTTSIFNGEDVVIGTSNDSLHFIDYVTFEESHKSLNLKGYPKRIRLEGQYLVLTGGGFGYIEIDKDTYDINKKMVGDLLYNTREESIRIDDYISISSYGHQIGVYNYENSQIVYLIERLPDYVKAIKHYKGGNGENYLIIGGNNGFLQCYRVNKDGSLLLIKEYIF